MGAPAIVVASDRHGPALTEAFARYEREYDVRHVADESAIRAVAEELMGSGQQVALFVVDTDQDRASSTHSSPGPARPFPPRGGSSCRT